MAKAFIPVVFTANDLLEGDTVYLGAEGWVRDIAAASVAMTEAEAGALAEAAAEAVAANRVVGPYDVAVGIENGSPVPVKRRERIKASGRTTMPVGAAAAPTADRGRERAA